MKIKIDLFDIAVFLIVAALILPYYGLSHFVANIMDAIGVVLCLADFFLF